MQNVDIGRIQQEISCDGRGGSEKGHRKVEDRAERQERKKGLQRHLVAVWSLQVACLPLTGRGHNKKPVQCEKTRCISQRMNYLHNVAPCHDN